MNINLTCHSLGTLLHPADFFHIIIVFPILSLVLVFVHCVPMIMHFVSWIYAPCSFLTASWFSGDGSSVGGQLSYIVYLCFACNDCFCYTLGTCFFWLYQIWGAKNTFRPRGRIFWDFLLKLHTLHTSSILNPFFQVPSQSGKKWLSCNHWVQIILIQPICILRIWYQLGYKVYSITHHISKMERFLCMFRAILGAV